MANPSWEHKSCAEHYEDMVALVMAIRSELVEIFQTSLLKPVDADIETRLRLKDLIEKLKEFGEN